MSEAQYDHSEAGQGDSPRRQADDHASDDADEYSPRGGGQRRKAARLQGNITTARPQIPAQHVAE
jgi:hypothetical protein